jgi:5-(carboxyamino)imidazole ribonucleotide synthase
MPLAFGSTIGILGGGQLARMLAMAAARLGYKTCVFDPDSGASAAQVTNAHIVAPYDDEAQLEAFARSCAVVTYEFENVPISCVKKINDISLVYPGVKALEISQDRLIEKTFLNNNGISTAPFREVNSDEDLKVALDGFQNQGVLKTRRFGYDGKGQMVLRECTLESLPAIYDQFNGAPLILEGFVPFEREISIMAARGIDGKISLYEPSKNIHINGILYSSTVPAGIPNQTLVAAQEIAITILKQLEYYGVIGIEFFMLQDGRLLVNEIAPRVHNSGHWTEAACLISQFEQHIRAIVGLPLGSTKRHFNCMMQNLIGFDIDDIVKLSTEDNIMINHYGKNITRQGRKMGHFTKIVPITEGF